MVIMSEDDCENKKSSLGKRWLVLHVKPRTEKKIVEWLKIYKLWHHFPTYTKTTKVQRRKVVRTLPLFPGYVFASLNGDDRLKMLKTNYVVRVIEVMQPREMIHQLRQISRIRRAGGELRTIERFKEGDFVKVKHGPFYGVEGYVKRDKGGAAIVINVEILGQAVAVSISPEDCEKL